MLGEAHGAQPSAPPPPARPAQPCPTGRGWQGCCSVARWERVHVLGSSSWRKLLWFACPLPPARLSPHCLGAGTRLRREQGSPEGEGDPASAPDLGSQVLRWLRDGGCSRRVLLLAGCLWQPRASPGERSAQGWPRQPGCESQVGAHGCPSALALLLGAPQGQPCALWRAEGTTGSGLLPMPWSRSRAVAWKIRWRGGAEARS